ncbi:MAG: hypothetical protein GY757_07205 [bacterium]|nr:hypothetical protein [bacterium]
MKTSVFTFFVLLLVLAVMPLSSAEKATILPALELPVPTGSFKVGTTFLYFSDKSRSERYSDNKNDFRELSLQAWYPANPGNKNTFAPYLRIPATTGPAYYRSFLSRVPANFGTFSDASMEKIASGKTHSYLDAPLAGENKSFPVLIFSHGYGGSSTQNTAQMEEFASHGYVVFSISHSYESVISVFPDGHSVLYAAKKIMEMQQSEGKIINPLFEKLQKASSEEEKLSLFKQICEASKEMKLSLDTWAGDIRFIVGKLKVLNAGSVSKVNCRLPQLFKGKLNLEKLGAMGHSFGGAAAVQACAADNRIKAAINMDGLSYGTWHFKSSMSRPFMKMQSERSAHRLIPNVYNKATSNAYILTVKGAGHYNFTDMSFFPPFMRAVGFVGTIDGNRMTKIMNTYTRAFFDMHLLSKKNPLLDGPSTDYPEIVFVSKK